VSHLIFSSPCDGYECQDFANCVDRSTVYDPIPTCVCQLGRWYDKVKFESGNIIGIHIFINWTTTTSPVPGKNKVFYGNPFL